MVMMLQYDNSDYNAVTSNGKHMIMYFAPWCKHCKKAKVDFSAAAHELLDHEVEFNAVDCTKDKSICQDVDVKSYPTFKFVDNGDTQSVILLDRTKDSFVYATKYPGVPPIPKGGSKVTLAKVQFFEKSNISLIETNEQFYKTIQDKTLVIYYAPYCQHTKKAKGNFILLALKDDVNVAAIDCSMNRQLCRDNDVKKLSNYYVI